MARGKEQLEMQSARAREFPGSAGEALSARTHIAALEAAANAIFIADAELRIQWVNRAFTTTTGYTLEEIVGRSARFLREGAGDATSFEETARAIAAGQPWQGDVANRRKDGTIVRLLVSETPVRDPRGAITHVIGVAQDVTERRRAETDLRIRVAALEAAANAITITDRDGHIEWVNDAFTKLSGYTREEVVGQTPRLLKSGQQDEGFYRELWGTVLAGNVWRGEMTNRRKDGSLYIQEATITPVRDESGAIVRLVGVGQDVTERRDLEAQLRQAQKMEAVGQLAGGIAHDFNNLLTTVLASAEMLSDQIPRASSLREDVDAIAKAGKRGAELTRNLLAFSRRQRLEMQVVDLTAVIAEFAQIIRRVLREDIVLRVDLYEPVWVRADPMAVEQMLMNLATNARDAMPSGGTLAIEAGHERLEEGSPLLNGSGKPGDHAIITVRDTGAGMTDEVRRRVFEPFFTTKPVGSGTGLGMAMVYGLMKQLSGVVSVESELGRGTSIRLAFPLVAPAPRAVEPAADTRQATSALLETILVVDDDPTVRRVAERALTRHGYRVQGMEDGITALEAVLRGDATVDLIVTDAVMPGLGGSDLCKRLRAAGVTTPVLITSGNSAREVLGDASLKGVAFLGKPWTIPELLAKVRETLRGAGAKPG